MFNINNMTREERDNYFKDILNKNWERDKKAYFLLAKKEKEEMLQVGKLAKSLETGWIGQIREITTEIVHIDDKRSFEQKIAKMIGVETISLALNAQIVLCEDDIRWFALDDLLPF